MIQDFLVSLAKILDILGFLAKKSKHFFGFLSTILKNLANLAKNNCQDLGKKFQKSKKFLGKKTKKPNTGLLLTMILLTMVNWALPTIMTVCFSRNCTEFSQKLFRAIICTGCVLLAAWYHQHTSPVSSTLHQSEIIIYSIGKTFQLLFSTKKASNMALRVTPFLIGSYFEAECSKLLLVFCQLENSEWVVQKLLGYWYHRVFQQQVIKQRIESFRVVKENRVHLIFCHLIFLAFYWFLAFLFAAWVTSSIVHWWSIYIDKL